MSTASAIARFVPDEELDGFSAGQLLEVTKAITMILSIPPAATNHIDAVAVATGQGEEWRFTHAIRAWEANPRLRHLLVTSGNPAERTYTEVTLDYVRGLGLRRREGLQLQPDPSPNTGRQAAWIADQVRESDVTSIALTTSPYHLPRFYLTVLKELDRRSIRIPVVPAPAAVAPQTPIPETGVTSEDLIPGEVKRILTYLNKGWLATPQELRRYLSWLWSNHGSDWLVP
ncbi:ElyC/SanA/YdcF family protein [Salinispora pacifica]|uniref:ElyC/SanA/YdcF family protein n=1 Tax=Salinispora pacifica TaxID=351187 RepID=UPI00036C7A17|nr:ElyC/SanA/YdcF family protein [Salinispora pacifica]